MTHVHTHTLLLPSNLTSHLSNVFGLLRDELSVEIVMRVSDAVVIKRSSNDYMNFH